jgi:hypothetical protein
MYWGCSVDHGEVARLQRGVAKREAEASAHGTTVHHARHPNYKHMAWHASQHVATQSRSGLCGLRHKAVQAREAMRTRLGEEFLSAAHQWLVAGLRRPRPTLAQW